MAASPGGVTPAAFLPLPILVLRTGPMLRWMLAALHLLGFGIGLGAVWARARSIGGRPLDLPALHRAFAADSWWGVSAILLVGTGLWRLLAGTEKPTAYYLSSHAFFGKMALLIGILLLEIWPMITLIRWRVQVAKGSLPDPSSAAAIARISYAQAALLIGMVLAATAMARGMG
jgi:putative membrane protein